MVSMAVSKEVQALIDAGVVSKNDDMNLEEVTNKWQNLFDDLKQSEGRILRAHNVNQSATPHTYKLKILKNRAYGKINFKSEPKIEQTMTRLFDVPKN